MRIHIRLNAPVTDEKRAYAEYRFFTAIAPYWVRVRAVDVAVVQNGQFLCTARVDLGAAGQVEAQARATHPTAAIDRAADRIARLVARRMGSHVPAFD